MIAAPKVVTGFVISTGHFDFLLTLQLSRIEKFRIWFSECIRCKELRKLKEYRIYLKYQLFVFESFKVLTKCITQKFVYSNTRKVNKCSVWFSSRGSEKSFESKLLATSLLKILWDFWRFWFTNIGIISKLNIPEDIRFLSFQMSLNVNLSRIWPKLYEIFSDLWAVMHTPGHLAKMRAISCCNWVVKR